MLIKTANEGKTDIGFPLVFYCNYALHYRH